MVVNLIPAALRNSKAAIFLASFSMCSCADLWNTVQKAEVYEYVDIHQNRYHLKFANGVISGESMVVSKNGDTLEILRWSKKDSVQRKPFWKGIEVFYSDTVTFKITERGKSCTDNLGNSRSQKDLSKPIDQVWVDIKREYRTFLKVHRFGGDMLFRILVSPGGKIDRIYILRNTSGDHEFGETVLKILNAVRFSQSSHDCRDVIMIPFRFRP